MKMSLVRAFYGILVLMPINKVLSKDIQMEFIIQEDQLEVREAKEPQKVSILF